MIRHQVFLRFKDSVTATQIESVYDQLAGLKSYIEGIVDFQYRDNISVELPLVRGFNHMFWFDFKDLDVRDAYLVNVQHQQVGGNIVALLEGEAAGVFVCDVEL